MNWVKQLFSRRHLYGDLSEEIQEHLAEKVEELVASGMSREEATYAARREFGNATLIEERGREVWSWNWLETLGQDLRYGCRQLRRNPGFTIAAVLTLALGIGINTTLFTAFDAVALRPLPVADSHNVFRLVRSLASGAQGDVQYGFSYSEFLQYRRSNSFSGLIAASWPVSLSAAFPGTARTGSVAFGEPQGVQGEFVSWNYFAVLGVSPALGRTFLSEENPLSAVAVLSFPFWQRRLNSDPTILGKTLKLNGTPLTVVGVAGRDFIGTANPPLIPDLWTPLAMQPQLIPGEDWLHEAADYQVQLLGRLSPETRLKQAEAEMTLAAQRCQSAEKNTARDRTVAVALQRATFFGETNDVRFRAFIGLLMVLVGLVLLMACANLANMVLARCAARQRETAVRLAIGASRGRLIRQWLTETVLLGLLGGAVGLRLSMWATRVLWLAITPVLQKLFEISPSAVQLSPDLRVFGYTLLVSIVAGVAFGLSPALRFSKPGLAAAIRDEGTAFGRNVRRSELRGFLVTAEVAVSALLLVTASLLVRGVVKSQTTDPGFETKHVIGPLALWFSNDPAKSNALARGVIDRLSELPVVGSVGLVYRAPWSGTWTPPVRVEETKAAPKSLPWQVLANYVSPAYFTALSIPILRGRNFSRYESDSGAPVAIVSESAARRFWPGEDPIGKRISLDMSFEGSWARFQVIGVAKDVRTANLSRVDPGYVYLATNASKLYNYEALIRIQGDRTAALASVRSALEDLDRTQFPPGMWLDTLAEGPLRTQKMVPQAIAWFALSLGVLALLLATVGVYGVVNYAVGGSTHEIGVRMALGATKSDVLRWALRQKVRPVVLGGVTGLAFSLAVSTLLRAALAVPGNPDLLFGASSFDAATFAGAFALLGGLAFIACFIPARRAAKVDPMVALRHE